MGGKKQLSDNDLQVAADNYVKSKLRAPGGFVEGQRGFFHKTLPFYLGLESSISVWKIFALVVRVLLFCITAAFPIFARKVLTAPPTNSSAGVGTPGLMEVVSKLDGTDLTLAALFVAATGVPKMLDMRAKRKPNAGVHTPYSDLAAAIEKAPPAALLSPQNNGNTDDSLRLTLNALRSEMSELIGDERHTRLTDVTLLEFCDLDGFQMQVRARTANEPCKRPRHARLFMAYYVGLNGRWVAEHDFLHPANPFQPTRLTVQGGQPVDYRSVLYLPLFSSVQTSVPLDGGLHGAPMPKVDDYCIGVICVHSAKPFRFWRWGDHKRQTGTFGNVAMQRALPYIALITKLIESSAHKVKLETP